MSNEYILPIDFTDLCFELSQRIGQGASLEFVRQVMLSFQIVTNSPSLEQVTKFGVFERNQDPLSESSVMYGMLDALRNGYYENTDDFKMSVNKCVTAYRSAQTNSLASRLEYLQSILYSTLSAIGLCTATSMYLFGNLPNKGVSSLGVFGTALLLAMAAKKANQSMSTLRNKVKADTDLSFRKGVPL